MTDDQYLLPNGNLLVPSDLVKAAISAGSGGPLLSKEQWMQAARITAAALEQAGNRIKRMRIALEAAEKDLATLQREMSGIAPEAIPPSLALIRQVLHEQ